MRETRQGGPCGNAQRRRRSALVRSRLHYREKINTALVQRRSEKRMDGTTERPGYWDEGAYHQRNGRNKKQGGGKRTNNPHMRVNDTHMRTIHMRDTRWGTEKTVAKKNCSEIAKIRKSEERRELFPPASLFYVALPWRGAGLRSFPLGLRPFLRSSSSGFLSMISMGTCPVARSWIRRFRSGDICSFSPGDGPSQMDVAPGTGRRTCVIQRPTCTRCLFTAPPL